MESDSESGIAHFVEHMAFNGSRNIPKDQLLPLMQRHGIRIGPDAGAITLPNKTEYTLNLPANDKESIDTGLMIAREFSGNLLFEPESVERERAVILNEARLRDTPLMIAQVEWLRAAFPGQKFGTHGDPIGLQETVSSIKPDALQRFYNAFYRPEQTTLVVVGDVDPDQIEAAIKAQFNDWRATGRASSPTFTQYASKGLTTYTRAAPGLPDTLSATWLKPFQAAPRTRRMSDEALVDFILVAALNSRLQHLAQQPDSAFAGAMVATQSLPYTAEVVQLNVLPKPDKAAAALKQALTTVRQFQAGVSHDEITPVLARLDGFFQQQAGGAKARDNEAIVNNLISNLDANSVFTSPEQDLASYRRIAQDLTPDRINARIKVLFDGDGPLLSHTAEKLGDLDASAMKTIFKTVSGASMQTYATETTKIWPYSDFGTPQAPVSQLTFREPAFTRYVFANGLKVNVMPTRFKDNQVLVSVNFKGGLKSLSPETDAVALTNMYAAMGGFFAGGLGKLDVEQLQRVLAGKTLALTFNIGEDATVLTGATTRADLSMQLELLMAFAADPAHRPMFFEQFRTALPAIYTQLYGAPQPVLQSYLPGVAHENDKRFAFPSMQEAGSVSLDQMKALMRAAVTDKPLEITIVGDIDPASTIAMVSRTFATLPKMPAEAAPAPGGEHTAFPAQARHVVMTHKGRGDQAASLLAWPVPGELAETQTSRTLEILTEILTQRAFATIRQSLGQAYDAGAVRQQSWAFKDFGFIAVQGSVAAGNDAPFVDAVTGIVEDLKTRPVSQDELDRARKPLLERWKNDRLGNQQWVYIIPSLADDQAKAAADTRWRDEIQKVTPAMLSDAAKTYFVSARRLHVEVLPEAAAGKSQ